MANILFITDSAADIPAELAAELGIRVLPFPIISDGKEYLDGIDFSRTEFYDFLSNAAEIPSHAQITPFQFEELYADAFASGCSDVIFTSINFKGSSTGQNAVQAKNLFFSEHPEAEGKMSIHVLDSHGYTFAYGYAVVEGAKMAKNGASCAEVLAMMQDWIDHYDILFATYDLKFARKSGRVSAAAAIVGSALGICPIMSFPDGDSKVVAKVRGTKAVVSNIAKLLDANADKDAPYLVIHAALPERNQEISDACRAVMGKDAAYTFMIGGVIAINAGPQVVGVVYRKK